MLTIIGVVIFGGLIVGFAIWAVAFGGMKRRGQSGTGQMEKRATKEGRASGLD